MVYLKVRHGWISYLRRDGVWSGWEWDDTLARRFLLLYKSVNY